MGVAAYNRGTKAIQRDCERADRDPAFVLMDTLNGMPKIEGSRAPFGPIHFVHGHGGVWAECPETGFGYWYRTLREAVANWRVIVVEVRGEVFVGVPE